MYLRQLTSDESACLAGATGSPEYRAWLGAMRDRRDAFLALQNARIRWQQSLREQWSAAARAECWTAIVQAEAAVIASQAALNACGGFGGVPPN